MINKIKMSFFLIILALLTEQTGLAREFRPISKGPTTVVNYLGQLFFLSKNSGSLILKGTCKATSSGNDVVSEDIPHPPQGSFQDLGAALSVVAQLDPHLSWSQDADGLVRVRDDRVSNDVLGIRLEHVHFNRARDLNAAIRMVLNTSEVQAYFKQNHIEMATPFIDLSAMNSKGLPKLSGDLYNVTVTAALDTVIRFFPGLWIYRECESASVRRVIISGLIVPEAGGTGLK